MSSGLDHVVHAVRDLGRAADLYARLGFQVGGRNRHPRSWGTENHIVQLPGTFIELLTVADSTHIAPHASNFFSFGAFNRDFLARGQGLSMLVLEGRGAPDAEAFRAAGIGDFQVYDFEREAKRPDGTPIKVAFSLAFASDPQASDVGFFTCQHRHPENFWNPAFQVHANTAAGVAGVVLVADDPARHRDFLSAFTGGREAEMSAGAMTVATPRGDIQVMKPSVFGDRFGTTPPDTSRGARLAAIRFSVRDFAAAVAALKAGEVDAEVCSGRIVVGPEIALGATLVFEVT